MTKCMLEFCTWSVDGDRQGGQKVKMRKEKEEKQGEKGGSHRQRGNRHVC